MRIPRVPKVAAALGLASLALTAPLSAAPPARPPNVVIIRPCCSTSTRIRARVSMWPGVTRTSLLPFAPSRPRTRARSCRSRTSSRSARPH